MPIAKVDNENINIYYEIHGTGPEKVVLIMGLGCSHLAWIPTATELAKTGKYTFLLFDNRGVGRSSVPRGFYKTKRMALDTLELIDSLGPEWKTVHVVGYSMGGMISQELALMLYKSNRLLSLSLFVTHAGRSHSRRPPRKGVVRLVRSFLSQELERKASLINDCLYSQEFLNTSKEEGKTMRDYAIELYIVRGRSEPKFRLAGFLGQISAVLKHNIHQQDLLSLGESRIPILIGTGTNDHLVDHRNSDYLSQVLKPVEYKIWEGAGHGLPLEKFEEFNAAILRNLERGCQSMKRGIQ